MRSEAASDLAALDWRASGQFGSGERLEPEGEVVRRGLHGAGLPPLKAADQVRIGRVAALAPERVERRVADRLARVGRVAPNGADEPGDPLMGCIQRRCENIL